MDEIEPEVLFKFSKRASESCSKERMGAFNKKSSKI